MITLPLLLLPLPAADCTDETVVWRGRPLCLRSLRPADGARHGAFFAHLAAADLRLRFFSSRRELPQAEIDQLVHPDAATEVALLLLAPLPGEAADVASEELATARAVAGADNLEAEFGITVRSDLKGQGLGALLLTRLIAQVRRRGTQRIVCEVLRENTPMRALATRLGFRVESRTQEHGSLRYVLDLQAGKPAATGG
jgi:acetyltransferase